MDNQVATTVSLQLLKSEKKCDCCKSSGVGGARRILQTKCQRTFSWVEENSENEKNSNEWRTSVSYFCHFPRRHFVGLQFNFIFYAVKILAEPATKMVVLFLVLFLILAQRLLPKSCCCSLNGAVTG